MTSNYAYEFARKNPDCDISEYQALACKDPYRAYLFAMDVPKADVKYCQKHACKGPEWPYGFARDIAEADIEYCYNLSGNRNGFSASKNALFSRLIARL